MADQSQNGPTMDAPQTVYFFFNKTALSMQLNHLLIFLYKLSNATYM